MGYQSTPGFFLYVRTCFLVPDQGIQNLEDKPNFSSSSLTLLHVGIHGPKDLHIARVKLKFHLFKVNRWYDNTQYNMSKNW